MYSGFKLRNGDGSSSGFPLSKGDNKIENAYYGFYCDFDNGIASFDLSNYRTDNITNMRSMFDSCSHLTSLDLSNFDTSKVTDMYKMFGYCRSLTHIKCKQAFKDWCIKNKNTISLPTAMINGSVGAVGSGSNWEIVDL